MSSKVKRITVSNLKAITDLTADFNGMTVIVTGGNDKGKSSFLKSLPERLRGHTPGIILKEGEGKGFAQWDLTTGEKFIWTFDDTGKEKLTFISERDLKSPVTKAISNIFFPQVFDVDIFLQSGPKKQKEELQKLSGIDFTDIEEDYDKAYKDRTFQNRKLAEDKAKLVEPDKTAPKKVLGTETLEQELAGIDTFNEKVLMKQESHDSKLNAISVNHNEITSLKLKIETLEKANTYLRAETKELNDWITKPENKAKEQIDIDTLKENIEKIKTDNKKVEENERRELQKKEWRKQVDRAKSADDKVKKIEQDKLDMIKNSSLPEGFGFTDEGITYNGFEFTKDQLSSSGIYIAALKLAAVGLGVVRTLHFDASFLDKKNLLKIEKWANENDLQLLIERPSWESGEISYEIVQPKAGK